MHERYRHIEFKAMACRCELVVPSDTPAAVIDAATAEVWRIERKYSRYQDDSVVSRINAQAGLADVEIDQETYNLLMYARTCFELSDGVFDITSGLLRKAWRFPHASRGEGFAAHVPTPDELEPLLARIDFRKLRFDEKRARLQMPGMELDFGGFGKEYAADRAAAVLRAQGVHSALVNLGGDVASIGDKQGQSWSIGIQSPRHSRTSLHADIHRDEAIATSGDYERYFELDGKRYSHIVNAKTGMSVSHAQSISVIAPCCLAAGSLCTIAMLLEDQGLAFLRAQKLAFLWIGPDGQLVST